MQVHTVAAKHEGAFASALAASRLLKRRHSPDAQDADKVAEA